MSRILFPDPPIGFPPVADRKVIYSATRPSTSSRNLMTDFQGTGHTIPEFQYVKTGPQRKKADGAALGRNELKSAECKMKIAAIHQSS
jgi:hypothetical protein